MSWSNQPNQVYPNEQSNQGLLYSVPSIRPNEPSVFWVMSLKILGRVGMHIFSLFFSGKKNNFMHFERHFAFQNEKNYIFSRKPEKIQG